MSTPSIEPIQMYLESLEVFAAGSKLLPKSPRAGPHAFTRARVLGYQIESTPGASKAKR